MRVLLTGATGFIGSQLAVWLQANAVDYVATGAINSDAERFRASLLVSSGIKLHIGSLLQSAFLTELGSGFTHVVHLAAAQHETAVTTEYFREHNIGMTQRLLDWAVANGRPRFLYGGTIGAYGAGSLQPMGEHHPTNPLNDYEHSKVAAEGLVAQFASQLPTVVARIGEAYGDGDFRLLKLFRAIKRRRFAIIGTGSNLHQPIHIRDLCECLFALCKLPAGSGQIFNVAGADIVSTRDMANAVAAALSQPASFPRLPMWPMTTLATTAEFVCKPLGVAPPLSNRSLDFFRRTLLLDCSRLELATGASATTRFTQGAATTATWYRANGLL